MSATWAFDSGAGHVAHLDQIPLGSGIPLQVPSQGGGRVFVLACLASFSSSLAHLAEILCLVLCLLGAPTLGARALWSDPAGLESWLCHLLSGGPPLSA